MRGDESGVSVRETCSVIVDLRDILQELEVLDGDFVLADALSLKSGLCV